MKILQISASYKPAYVYGGPIMSVSMLAEQLVKKKISADVFTTTANGGEELPVEAGKAMLVDGVNVTYFTRVTKDHTHFSPALLLQLWQKAKDYDIIHIHAWWNLVSILSCLVAKMRKVQVVVSPRGTLSSYSFGNKNNMIKGLIHKFITKPLLKQCFIHTTSENEYRAVQKIIKAKAFFTIPNFIRLGVTKIYPELQPHNYLKLIFLSRIEEKKGLDILLNSLPNLKFPYRLTIVGDGDAGYVNSLKAITIKNDTSQYIVWLGFRGDDKFKLLHEHDLLVLPSHDENFGNVVIESLSVGTAVLVSNEVGLANYIMENNFGWTCETNSGSLSQSVISIFYKRQDLELIKINAPTKILSDFNESALVKKYTNMYTQIMSYSAINDVNSTKS